MAWERGLEFLTSGWMLFAQIGPDEAPPADAAAEGAQGGGNTLMTFLLQPMNFLLLLLMLFYFIVLLPQQRQMRSQQKALSDALSNLKKNDRIVTTGGIHGTVIQTTPEAGTVTIRIDESTGAKLTISKEAVSRVIDPDAKTASKPS